MKKIKPSQFSISLFTKSIAGLFKSLFFNDSSKEFERLKNFIAS